MGWFTTRTRRGTTADPGAGRELSSELRAALPPRFEAVGEALASGSGTASACEVVGAASPATAAPSPRRSTRSPTTTALVRPDPTRSTPRPGRSASPGATRPSATCTVSPATTRSPASPAWHHLRSRISEVYRGRSPSPTTTRSVVARRPAPTRPGRDDVLTRAMRVARLGDTARTVFSGPETIGHLAPGRVVVLAGRDDRIARRVGLLRRMLDAGPDATDPGLDRGAAGHRRGAGRAARRAHARLTVGRVRLLGWPHVRPLRVEPAPRGPRRGVRDRRRARSRRRWRPTTTSPRPRRSTPSSSGLPAKDSPEPPGAPAAGADAGGWCRPGPRTPRSATG